MIEQRVMLTEECHKVLREAQTAIGIARFEDALGYFVEGCIDTLTAASIDRRMIRGMQAYLARKAREASIQHPHGRVV